MITTIAIVLFVLLFLGSSAARKVAGVILLIALFPLMFGIAAVIMVFITEAIK